jgi:hypothetical protein
VRFPGNPIVKNRRKPLKNGVKKVTFLQLEEGISKVPGGETRMKTLFKSMMTGVK